MGKEAALSPWQRETGWGLEPSTSPVPVEDDPRGGQAFLCEMGAKTPEAVLRLR